MVGYVAALHCAESWVDLHAGSGSGSTLLPNQCTHRLTACKQAALPAQSPAVVADLLHESQKVHILLLSQTEGSLGEDQGDSVAL